MPLDIQRFIQRFIEEARDQLQQVNQGLDQLQPGAVDSEQIHRLFRALHTLKGSSRMLKLLPLTHLAHSGEDLLSALREPDAVLDAQALDLLYQVHDGLQQLVEQLAQEPDPSLLPEADEALCRALTEAAQAVQRQGAEMSSEAVAPEAVAEAEAFAPAQALASLTASQPSPTMPQPRQQAAAVIDEVRPELQTSTSVRVSLERLDELLQKLGEVVQCQAAFPVMLRQMKPLQQQTLAALPPELSQAWVQHQREWRDRVAAQSQLMEDLYDQLLQLRMLPLSQVFDPAARLVREQARALGKQAQCHIEGAQLELDRQLIDQLADPLVHLLSNALDHGIETPEVRLAAGKPAQGHIQLEAQQDGHWAVIRLSDDGAGIDPQRVAEKARHKKLVTAEELATMSEAEMMQLIFTPGFSTSELITEFSGRGVGLDVVRRKVQDDLKGTLQITSQVGQGTCFTLRLPLSLARMRVLLVACQGRLFGFGAQYVVELLRTRSEDLLDFAQGPAVVVHNEFVPCIPLSQLLGLGQPKRTSSSLLLLIIKLQHSKLALEIDALVDEKDLLIEPLPPLLRAGEKLVTGLVHYGKDELVSLLHPPRLMATFRQQRQTPRPRAEAPTSAKRILVVDDSLSTREIERDLLQAWGYQVVLAEQGAEGLEKAQQQVFDAVITDVEMPIMDGFSLTAALRQLEAYQHCPILILTSREKEEDKRRGLEVGADAYLVKGSFDQSSLIDTLQLLLGDATGAETPLVPQR
ncbi:hybrid sensor histidine kinase/response regulator [Marinospirillum sp. MEB164]|uniref:histidine kinase n=1 Tax=Marinospirillum alkalitolerans TaxID=3123374 RepID=A0ABW8PYP4_9GAMM